MEAARRQLQESQRLLDEAKVVGLGEAEARSRIEAAGLRFRAVSLDGSAPQVLTADLNLKRVTADIRAGVVDRVDIG